jgi:HTH-type transcriptional regulator/antitoxin HigA
MTTKTSAADDRYLQLIREFPLRPLRSEADLDRAVAMLDALTDRGELAGDERDYLQVLSGLVHDYEREHDPLPGMSPVEALRYLLDENEMTQARLSEQTGIAVATISEILNGKRGISPTVRKALATRFKVDGALFV